MEVQVLPDKHQEDSSFHGDSHLLTPKEAFITSILIGYGFPPYTDVLSPSCRATPFLVGTIYEIIDH